jgi:DNA-binding cell septation regulator SpoVG
MTLEIIDLKRWTGSGQIIAFFGVRIGDVTVHDARLIRGERGLFIAGPSAQRKNGQWNRYASFTPELANKILLAVEAALADGC